MPPLVSCHPRSYGRFGLRAAAEHLPSVGISHVELPIELDPTAMQETRQILDGAGLNVASLDVTGGNPVERSVVETVKRKIDIAAEFGATIVVGPSGEADDEALPMLYRHLAELGDHAAARGIRYCLITEPGVCVNASAMLETMRVLEHPNIRLSFDPGVLLYYNQNATAEIALAKVCHLVGHVRLKDSQGEYGRWHFPALGFGGAVDFLRTLQLMRDSGFAGPYVIDVAGIAAEPEPSLDEHRRRVKASVQHLRSLGYFR